MRNLRKKLRVSTSTKRCFSYAQITDTYINDFHKPNILDIMDKTVVITINAYTRRPEMELLQAIQTRHSTRKFKTDSVEKNKLEYIIEAGRMAPSGGNTQLTHFVVITNPGVLAKLITLVQEEYGKMEITENTLPYMVNIIKAAAAGTFVFNYNAPALVILTSPRTYGNNFADSACAMQNMMLAANELNLGSCWVNQLRWLHDNPVVMDFLATLGISQDEMVCASLVVGYANLPNGLPIRKVNEPKGYKVTFID